MSEDRAKLVGFTDDPTGFHAIRPLEGEAAFKFGMNMHEIGEWALEHGYKIMLAYRQRVVVDGVEHDCTQHPALVMEDADHLVAFKMRWF